MEKLYVVVNKRTEARINGKLYIVEAGPQELDRDLAELLLNVGLAFLPDASPTSNSQPSQDFPTSAESKLKEKNKRSRK